MASKDPSESFWQRLVGVVAGCKSKASKATEEMDSNDFWGRQSMRKKPIKEENPRIPEDKIQHRVSFVCEPISPKPIIYINRPRYKDTSGNQQLIFSEMFYYLNPNYYFSTALHIASAKGHLHSIKELLESNADIEECNDLNNTPLHLAAANGHAASVELLLENGAQPNVRNGLGQTPLIVAAYSCRPFGVIKVLVNKKYKTDVNLCEYYGRTALHVIRCVEAAEFLLSSNAGVEIDAADFEGNTPLHLATSPSFAQLFLSYNADINRRNWKGRTPLIEASIKGIRDIVTVLLDPQYKADINARDYKGKTALIGAVENQYCTEVVKLLLEGGATVNLFDLRGFTALHAAVFYPEEQIFSDFESAFNTNKWDMIPWLRQSQSLVEILLNSNTCDLSAVDFSGRTSRDLELYALSVLKIANKFCPKDNPIKLITPKIPDATGRPTCVEPSSSSEPIAWRNKRGQTILHRMCTSCWVIPKFKTSLLSHEELLYLLNEQDDRGRTVLHYYAMSSLDKTYTKYIYAENMREFECEFKIKDNYDKIHSEYSEYGDIFQISTQISQDQSISHQPTGKCGGIYFQRKTKNSDHFSKTLSEIRINFKWDQLTKLNNGDILKSLPQKAYSSDAASIVWRDFEYAYRNYASIILRTEVGKFVSKLLKLVARKEPRFESKHVLVGSAYEGTKINDPDEFDFDVVLVKFNSLVAVVHSSDVPSGFVHLRKSHGSECEKREIFEKNVNATASSTPGKGEEFDSLFDKNEYLLTDEVSARFQTCVQETLYDPELWMNEHRFDIDNVYLPERKFLTTPRVCTTIKLQANQPIEGHYIFRKISIDLVPCIHIDNYWPENEIHSVNSNIKWIGCKLVFDQPHRKYPWISNSIPCARISFAEGESTMVSNSPAAARAAYMVAKHMLQKPEHSYILKTCLLYCLEAVERTGQEDSNFDKVTDAELLCWIRKIFLCYLQFCLQDFVPCYFMPDFHLPFNGYSKMNHELLNILGLNGKNGLEILEKIASRCLPGGHQRYCAKILNVIDGIMAAYQLYWSVSGDDPKIEFHLPDPHADHRSFSRENLIHSLRA